MLFVLKFRPIEKSLIPGLIQNVSIAGHFTHSEKRAMLFQNKRILQIFVGLSLKQKDLSDGARDFLGMKCSSVFIKRKSMIVHQVLK